MTDVYSYDSAVARDAEGGLSGTIASLQGHLDELGGFVNSVCANWEGDEQVIYHGIQSKWDGAAGQVLPLKILRPRAGILEVLHVLVTPTVH